ncbi:ARF GAP with effector function(s) [Vermiconidia calcicola]|uniref:ARF GAP with effector function(S) n=1 Tax=Vermiconidia calcicola TaxID=1690605 RepID=A0ACC3N2G5_9PEZI|nr:ARF GAP with effector function(s) [Vermiconidia calcicola]
MSRRPPTTADRTEQNRATLKQLVKLETNKSCADCKRNKHPRWASWNIGVFMCIRCSGIHRGMGTHISRVKSVDLDSWTDEQMANMLRWGNARANKYWEHKLAEGHVPNESKIENFIRTKYDSKRWAMDGPVPDPSTLDDGRADDDVPLNVVREKVVGDRERSANLRNGTGTGSGGALPGPPRAKPQQVDLFGDAEETAPARPSTTEPAVQRAGPSKAVAAPPKQTKPGESLLGLDFFGGTQSAPPARPSSTGPSTPGVPGRADLKSSILSLYASKPVAPPQPQQQPQQQMQAQSNTDFFGEMQSPPLVSPSQPQTSTQFGGMNDAFSSLSFTSPPQTQPKPSPFANFSPPAGQIKQQPAAKSSLSGGSFFDTKPAASSTPISPPSRPPVAAPRKESFGGDFGDFSSAALPPVATTKSPPPPAASSMGDLFDMSAPAPAPKQAPAAAPSKPSYTSNTSAFNLSQPTPQPPAPKQTAPAQTSNLSNFSTLNNMDAWGSSDAWATPDPTPQPAAPAAQTNKTTSNAFASKATSPPLPPAMQTAFDSGWGDVATPAKPAPTSTGGGGFSVQQDEEFGGWSHASPVATKPSGGGGAGLGGSSGGTGSDDLFGNVWG